MDATENQQPVDNMSKDSILDRLTGFDFSSPVEANVIFDDDEDQDPSTELVIKEEKIETEKFKDVLGGQVKVEAQKDLAVDSSHINTNINSKETEPNNNKDLKRKLHEEGFYTSKISRSIEGNNKPLKTNANQCNLNTLGNHTSFFEEDPPSVTKDSGNADNNSNPEMTCISKLLQSVSKHLILILDAYSKYLGLKANKAASTQELQRYNADFLRVKYHFFNLSFCTVDNIILPQEKNLFFTGRFLNDTVKLAALNKRILCLETQVAPLFMELLNWSKEKKLRINSLPTEAFHSTGQAQDNPLLRDQLRQPAKHIGLSSTSSIVTPDNSIRSVNTQQVSLHPAQTIMPNVGTNLLYNNNTSQNNHYQRLPSKSDEVSTIVGDINRYMQQCSAPNAPRQPVLFSNEGLHANRSVNAHTEQGNKMFMTTQGKNEVFSPNANATTTHYAKNTQVVNTHLPHQNNTDSGKSVLFSSGPPGRQISITVEQSLLQGNGNYNLTNTTAPIQSPRNVRVNQNYPNGPMHPNYEQSLNQAKQNGHQANQLYLNPQTARQGFVNNYQSFVNNYHHQKNVPHGYQNTSAAPTPPWQLIPEYNRPMEAQQVAPAQPLHIQTEHQNPEITRSISTDSGFMSPLNFNNSSETNGDRVEDNQSLPSPLITHVTSLHPEVSYLTEGVCCVCGKSTRKMCIGCYKQYYCSYNCQRDDWSTHQALCRKS